MNVVEIHFFFLCGIMVCGATGYDFKSPLMILENLAILFYICDNCIHMSYPQVKILAMSGGSGPQPFRKNEVCAL